MSSELTPGDPLWSGSARPTESPQPEVRPPAPSGAPEPSTRKRRHGWKAWLGFACATLVLIGVIGNALEEEPTAIDNAAQGSAEAPPATPTASATPAASPTPTVSVSVSSPSDGKTIRAPRVMIRGSVRPANARVKVAGHRVKVRGGKFQRSVPLQLGDNDLSIQASFDGQVDEVMRELTRKRSAREMAALRAKRAAARAAKRQTYINSAVTIPYNQLQKSADRHAGTRVAYYGQIFQIQEDADGGGMMLLSVTDAGFDFWTDEIWVNYDGRVQGAEGDMLTVYGKVVGSRDFETQGGGSRYVPEITARYILE